MFFRAVTTPLMTPVPNFDKWCAVSNFLSKNIDFCIFTPKTLLVKENYFLTLWNFTYLKDTSFGIKSCKFEHGLETKNVFEKWPLITFFQCIKKTYLPSFIICGHNLFRTLGLSITLAISSRRFMTISMFMYKESWSNRK